MLHDDVAVARNALRGSVATFARFSSMRGSPIESLPPPLRKTATYLRTHYDMAEHTRAGAQHTAGVDDDFVDWFAVAGPAERAIPRFQALAKIGLDFVHVIPGSTGVPRDVAAASLMTLGRDVLPAMRSA